MCHAKPGPRCSTHARAAYERTLTDPAATRDDISRAVADFSATPAGANDLTVLQLWAEEQGLPTVREDAEDRLVDARALRRRSWTAMGKDTDGAAALDRAATRAQEQWAALAPAQRAALAQEVLDRQGAGHAAYTGNEEPLRAQRPRWLDQSRTDAIFSPGGAPDPDGLQAAGEVAAARSLANMARNDADPAAAAMWRASAVAAFGRFTQTRTGARWLAEAHRGNRPVWTDGHDAEGAREVRLRLPGDATSHFPAPDEVRRGWRWADAQDRMLEHVGSSVAFTQSLTDDERDAVAYWTSAGAGVLGGWVHRRSGTLSDLFTKTSADRFMATLDSALAKAHSPTAQVVWRGLSNNTMRSPGDTEDGRRPREMDGMDWANEAHPVGSTVSFEIPGSASADPAKAFGFSGWPSVVYEVRTRRAAAVSAVSAWGASEREVLLPRHRAFRVVGVRTVQFGIKGYSGEEQTEPVTAIQLEDC